MNIETLIELQTLSQHRIILLAHEDFVEDAVNFEQTVYILNGTGNIEFGNKKSQVKCGDITHIPPNTALAIKNTSGVLLKILLTQAVAL